MTDDAERWDARYRDEKWSRDLEGDAFVLGSLDQLGPGAGRRALDLAAGTGRHALELAVRGWQVEAWDVSGVGLEILGRKAHERGLEVACRCVDLTERTPKAQLFDLIVVVNYLDRLLLGKLPRLLAPGGSLLLTTFTKDCADGPSPVHCLDPGELRGGLPGLRTLLHRESCGRASLWAELAVPRQHRT